MRYYISDLHFFHENLNKRLDNRGFSSAEEMNTYMIDRWNSKVRKNDEVVILGDFSMGNGNETTGILKRLQGKKYLIVGNHEDYLKDKNFDKSLFEWISDYGTLRDNKRKVILSHYPIFCYDDQYQWDKEGKPKTYMLYGHVHNSFDEILVNEFIHSTRKQRRRILGADGYREIPCNMINCFCMFSDYEPLSLDEWIEVDRRRREKTNALAEEMRNDGRLV